MDANTQLESIYTSLELMIKDGMVNKSEIDDYITLEIEFINIACFDINMVESLVSLRNRFLLT